MFDLVIENGTVVNSRGAFEGKVAVKNGRIAALLAGAVPAEAKEVLDARGLMVLPGLVDAHVHCGHGTPEREDFACVSRAAAAGGTTLMVDMPLSEPTTVTVEALEGKIASAGKQSVVDFALYSGIIPGHLDDIESTFSAGAQTYKIFTCRCSNYPMTYDGALLKGMRTVGKLGGMVCAHAENDTLIQELVDDLRAAGRNDARAFLDSHPEYTELEAVNRFIFLAGLVPECRAHICHLSIADGVRAVREARGRGMNNLSIETCPQYLALDEDDLVEGGAFAKCDPPVRRRETVEELWKYVLDGTVDMIASDHSPHSFEKKTAEGGNFWTVSEGCTGVQTLLPVVLTEGRKRGLSWKRLVELCCTRPAELFGLSGRKGDIAPGLDADFALVDPGAEWVLKDEDLFYRNRWSPYSGKTFRGKVVKTVVRGRTVFDGGKICAEEGYGTFCPMDMKGRSGQP
ncbi:MAG: allantoinase AllB [Aminivibrio sp.]|uniref:allantoinase AllB n=1 Tax=Aminivibrio sp. TaxID=1872489 RepID=UPI002B20CCF7|nr:allantoinase AllB [Aminivibrio sp.]MEA4952272.1 allantoinase AllB [Aminivibrio sp.]